VIRSGISWKAKKPYETQLSLIRNQQARGSTPRAGSSIKNNQGLVIL
jgi:hypothetical protein